MIQDTIQVISNPFFSGADDIIRVADFGNIDIRLLSREFTVYARVFYMREAVDGSVIHNGKNYTADMSGHHLADVLNDQRRIIKLTASDKNFVTINGVPVSPSEALDSNGNIKDGYLREFTYYASINATGQILTSIINLTKSAISMQDTLENNKLNIIKPRGVDVVRF